MATTSSRRTAAAGGGVGGKIVKNRRVPTTPYARPSPAPPPPPCDDPENPNWLSGLIYPAKVIASGAGKILSFFGNDYSSSSSDGDSSENDDDEEDIENDVPFQEDDQLDKVPSPSSKSDSKLAIEQLVTQEIYSRKEANELIKLVRSRIVGSNGETTPNMRTSAIMEARKWLQEKRSGSKKKFEDELDASNVASPSQISRNEKGSPVDMARSYMQNRPAWASPTLKQAEVGSSSPLGRLHFKEGTPMSNFRSSELKKSSFTSGSWNLLEEIRRVRSKATEELLAAAPLTKTILFSPESTLPRDSVLNKGVGEGTGPAESTHDRPENVLPDVEVSTRYRVSQEGEALQSVERQGSQEDAELAHDYDDEVKHLKSTTVENGYGCSASGFAQGQDTTNEARPSEGENGNLVDSSQVERDIHMEDNLNCQEDATIDISTDVVVNGSQNSSSMQQEELSQNFSQPVGEDSPASKVKVTQRERKPRGYTRRGRGKGK
ncbi:hypothetical protein SOVF_118250 isoform C [Spinacia oleracea]|uniref:Protein KAKU4 isoform X2 n=1 Tax=Spinacia oleracea TaxID=3562 RepID=A0A9R0J4Q0_SPIOL|nr:protein KAKU4 isoform X2 [Spinacia oleracea]KNA13207.1 hypothetical protein SOVF_118250 isoform C [Spinacia oleracea]